MATLVRVAALLGVNVTPIAAPPQRPRQAEANPEDAAPSPCAETPRPLPEAEQRPAAAGPRPTATVRVDTERLDHLMDTGRSTGNE